MHARGAGGGRRERVFIRPGVPWGLHKGPPRGIPRGIPQGVPRGVAQEAPPDPVGKPRDTKGIPQGAFQGIPEGVPLGRGAGSHDLP